jgi:RNase P subunit RPR2
MRLGDYIDDHCSRCKRTTDHSVVAMVGEEVVKVMCRTCNSEHKYRHNQSGKKDMTTGEAFQNVLANVSGGMPAGDDAAKKKKKSS